jgi:hypothetical protein
LSKWCRDDEDDGHQGPNVLEIADGASLEHAIRLGAAYPGAAAGAGGVVGVGAVVVAGRGGSGAVTLRTSASWSSRAAAAARTG